MVNCIKCGKLYFGSKCDCTDTSHPCSSCNGYGWTPVYIPFPRSSYPYGEWIQPPCPKCGGSGTVIGRWSY